MDTINVVVVAIIVFILSCIYYAYKLAKYEYANYKNGKTVFNIVLDLLFKPPVRGLFIKPVLYYLSLATGHLYRRYIRVDQTITNTVLHCFTYGKIVNHIVANTSTVNEYRKCSNLVIRDLDLIIADSYYDEHTLRLKNMIVEYANVNNFDVDMVGRIVKEQLNSFSDDHIYSKYYIATP